MRAILTALVALWTVTVNAQPHPERAFYTMRYDEATLEIIVPDEMAVVEYYNSSQLASWNAPRFVENGDLRVDLHVMITGEAETISVSPPAGWYADPPSLDIDDGDTGSFLIIRLRDWQGM